MRKSLLSATLLLSIMLCVASVSALSASFSPTSLIFNLSKGESACQTISFGGDAYKEIIFDNWAENKTVPWSVSGFKTNASSLGINISYPAEVLTTVGKVQVCVSGAKPGEYHGIVLLRGVNDNSATCPSGNACLTSIIQMGIWVKLTVNGVADPEPVVVQTPIVQTTPTSQTLAPAVTTAPVVQAQPSSPVSQATVTPQVSVTPTIKAPAQIEPVVKYYRLGRSYCKSTTSVIVNSKGIPRTSVRSVCSSRPII